MDNVTIIIEDFTQDVIIEVGEGAIQGEPGTNGTDGTDGVDGVDGTNGTNGVDGYTPIKGVDYFDGTNGTNGIDGVDGVDGYTPIKGTDYFDGVDGTNGTNGIDGIDGTNGIDGYTPIKGVDYFDGAQGTPGVDGTNGADGTNGTNGTDGVDGYTPIKGVDYFDGADGTNGTDGVDGYTPIKGTDYFDGAQGIAGVDGVDGTNGTNGTDGYTPIKGVDYFDGTDGTNGTNGVDGVDGYTPIKGVDYFDGAQGIPGIDGINGTNGIDGTDGVDGYTPIKGVDYFDGTNGTNGIDGADGTNGTNGIDGVDGYTPIKGVDYFDGTNGTNGIDGVDGTNGINGTDGYTPIKGVDYFDGEQGIQGIQGEPGTTDHLLLTNIGINTHEEIDTALDRLANTSGTNTGDQDLSGKLDVIPDYITFDTTPETSSTAQGTLAWNTDELTLDLIQNGTILQVGQEQQYNVRNNTGLTIPDGTPVMATGSLGASGRITVAKMDGTNPLNAKFFLGLTTEEILNGEDGKVTCFGKIRGLNTSIYADGDVLYISPTVAGGLTNVEPISTALSMPVAFVVYSASNGTLFVRVNNVNNHEFAERVHTHTASDITDFDTEVANNSAVTANSAKISFDTVSSARLANTSGTNTGDQDISGISTNATNLSNHISSHPAPTNRDTRNQVAGTYSTDIHSNITALNNVSGTNTGDNAVNTLYSGLVTNATHTGEVTGSDALTIASGVVDIDNLASELKATTNLGNVSGSVTINWALGIQYNLTMTGATTLTFSNMVQGKTITLIVTGNYTLAFPASVKGDITGFVGTKTNQIQLYCFDGTTPQCSIGILNW